MKPYFALRQLLGSVTEKEILDVQREDLRDLLDNIVANVSDPIDELQNIEIPTLMTTERVKEITTQLLTTLIEVEDWCHDTINDLTEKEV